MKNSQPAECLIVGAPGAGKTLFALSFLESLGLDEALIYHEAPGGRLSGRKWRIAEAKQALVGQAAGTTRGLQWATVDLPLGLAKGKRAVTIVDSTGLPVGVSDDAEIRDGAAQTLALLKRAHIILHLVDLTKTALTEVDTALMRFGQQLPPGRYLVLAGKADQLAANGWPARLRQAALGLDVMEVSAMRRRDMVAFTRRLRRALTLPVL